MAMRSRSHAQRVGYGGVAACLDLFHCAFQCAHDAPNFKHLHLIKIHDMSLPRIQAGSRQNAVMVSNPKKRTIQLEGEDRNRASQMKTDLGNNLNELGNLVLDTVHGKDRDKSNVKIAHVVFNNWKYVFSNGGACGVYEDPPGICRECDSGEAAVVLQA
jgi:hypothetical protein